MWRPLPDQDVYKVFDFQHPLGNLSNNDGDGYENGT